jgi:transposase
MQSSSPTSRRSSLPATAFLAVLTYCYSKQVYSTSEIARYLAREESFCRACLMTIPSLAEIQAFRKQNRALVERCLTVALEHVFAEQTCAELIMPLDRSFITEEAKRRMIMAACMDDLDRRNELETDSLV